MTIYRGSASAVRCSHAAGIVATPMATEVVTDKAVVLETASIEANRQMASMNDISSGGVEWATRAAREPLAREGSKGRDSGWSGGGIVRMGHRRETRAKLRSGPDLHNTVKRVLIR